MTPATISGYLALALGAAAGAFGLIRSDAAWVAIGAGLLGSPAVVKSAGRSQDNE